jgi:heme/copper-type cytochrome/quinol oxidase subunit 3
MTEATTPSSAELSAETEEAGFYHEAGLNAAWTASRLAIGGLCFLFGSFVFAYFYLRSVNSSGRWQGAGYHPPSFLMGSIIMAAVVVSAGIQYAGLQQIKSGNKGLWQIGALTALVLGVAAVVLQILELLYLPFWPGSSGFSSVFTGFYPVMLVSWLAAMIWLEILIMRARPLPSISFVEQPPTYAEAFAVQRFQSSLSAFTLIWNFIAIVTILFFILFYLAA